jgi:DNA-binding MarR family transcriptional regulator
MKNKDLLLQLIDLLDDFEQEYPEMESPGLDAFIGFVQVQRGQAPTCNQSFIRNVAGPLEEHVQNAGMNPETEITRLICMLYRYTRGYIKKGLLGSMIQTVDEFTFLIILLTHESLTKSELINKNAMESTSGTEVIRRLLRQGLIDQFDDPDDKRSRRVVITQKGRQEIFAVLPRVQMAAKIVAGTLAHSEKNTLIYLLRKLDYFHFPLFLDDKMAGLEDLSNKAGIMDYSEHS